MSASSTNGGNRPKPPVSQAADSPRRQPGWGTSVGVGFVLLTAVILMFRVGKQMGRENAVDNEIVPIEVPAEIQNSVVVRTPKTRTPRTPVESTGDDDDVTRVWVTPTRPAFIELDDDVPAAYRNSADPEVRMLGWLNHHGWTGALRLKDEPRDRAFRDFKDGPPDVPFEIYRLNSGSGVSGDGWTILRSLPNLRYASFSNGEFDDAALSQLVGHPNLTNISLMFTSVSDEGLQHLTTMGRLQAVTVACRPTGKLPRLTDAGLAHLARITDLQNVQLKYWDVSDDGVTRLAAACPTLRVLALDQCKRVTSVGVAHLATLPELWLLKLTGASLGPDAAQSLASLTQVTQLTLVDTGIGDETLEAISTLSQLRHLDLQNTEITDDGLQHVARLKLDSLMLGNTAVSDKGIEHLRGIPGLSSLNMSSTQVTDAALSVPASMTNLKSIYLKTTRITLAAAQALQDSRPDLRVHFDGVE